MVSVPVLIITCLKKVCNFISERKRFVSGGDHGFIFGTLLWGKNIWWGMQVYLCKYRLFVDKFITILTVYM